MDVLLHEQARAGRARLAGVLEDRVGDSLGGEIEVGVGEDDVG